MEASRRPWLARSVVAFALASLLSDAGHEMATAVLPMYLGTLGLGAAALGGIEGISDLVNGLSKLAGGAAGQRLRRKKPWTSAGYLVTAFCTSAIGLASSVAGLLGLRATAWASRGFRGPLRDFLVADAVEPAYYGRAFGLERAGDMVGAVLGPLLALSLLSAGLPFGRVVLVSAIPGALAALAVWGLVRERDSHGPSRGDAKARAGIPPDLWPWIGAVFLFGLGDFSRSLLILAASRAAGGGIGAAALGLPVVLYMVHNGVSAAATFPAGRAADRRGKGRVLAAGYLLGAACNVLLAVAYRSTAAVAAAFVISGIYIGVEETVEKAMIAERLPRESRSWGLGVLAAVNAAGDMVSSVMVGLLWDRGSGGMAFGAAAGFSIAGSAALLALVARSGAVTPAPRS